MDPFESILKSKLEGLEVYLKSGGRPLKMHANGHSLLSYSVTRHNFNAVMLLLGYNADINFVDEDGDTALHFVEMEDIAHALLINGASPNIHNRTQATPLHKAIKRNSPDVVSVLLKFNADPSLKNSFGQTALQYAVALNKSKSHEKLIEVLEDYYVNKADASNHDLTHSGKEQTDVHIDVERMKEIDEKITELKQNKIQLQLEIEEKEEEQGLKDITSIKKVISETCSNIDQLRCELHLSIGKLKELTEHSRKRQKRIESLRKLQGTIVNDSVDDRDYECPICLQLPLPPAFVYQCEEGHLYCSECKEKPNMDTCPQCKRSIKDKYIRNRLAEKMILQRFGR